MNLPKLMTKTKFNIITGVLLALVITNISVQVYNEPYNFIVEEKKEINFNSMLSLSQSFEDSANDILFLSAHGGINYTINHYSTTSVFRSSINMIEVLVKGDTGMVDNYLKPTNETWNLYPRGDGIDHSYYYTGFNQDYLQLLHQAFYLDISSIDNLQNITQNSVEEINLAKNQSNVKYFEIKHIYRDGTMLQFNIWGNTMIFQYYQLTTFLLDKESPVRGDYGVTFGPIYRNQIYPTYKAIVDDFVLSNYVQTINDIIYQLEV